MTSGHDLTQLKIVEPLVLSLIKREGEINVRDHSDQNNAKIMCCNRCYLRSLVKFQRLKADFIVKSKKILCMYNET